MLWKDVEKKYGKEIAKKMSMSPYLQGITVTMKGDEVDIPEYDLKLAYRDVTGKSIHWSEWD